MNAQGNGREGMSGQQSAIRVLIVDDIPETRDNLKKLLFFEADIEVAGAAASGEEAIALSKELQPDIVLMDINMPGLDGISASEVICGEVPAAGIIMMSVQGEADYLRRSMLAGAREFLIKPFSSDELVTTIRRVHAMGMTRRQALAQQMQAQAPAHPTAGTGKGSGVKGSIIALYAPKGGVGCSTLAVNLAVALQEQSRDLRVLLLDANLQFGGIDVLLNLQAPRSIVDLAGKADELDGDLIDNVLVGHACGMKILVAPPQPEMAELVKPEAMLVILKELRNHLDYIVIDTGSALHDMELTILDQADRVLLVTTPEIPAIKNAKTFLDVCSVLEYEEEKILLVVNQADRRGAIRPEDIEDSIKHPVVAAIPLDDRSASNAINQGVPLLSTGRNSAIAQSILALAAHLHGELAPPSEVEGPAVVGKAGRLFGLFRYAS